MTDITIDRFPVAQVAETLSISIRTLQRRCKELDLVPERDGREAYLSAKQMEELESHQAQRGELSLLGAALQRQSVQLMAREADAIELVNAIAQFLPHSQHDIFASHRALQEAAEKRWLLSTKQLSEILNLTPRAIKDGGSRLGFQFKRVGREWRVVVLCSTLDKSKIPTC